MAEVEILKPWRRNNDMLITEIIRNSIPEANDELCEHILWGRTPYPVGAITTKSLYQAANRYKRARDNGIRLCDFCDKIAMPHKCVCSSCDKALRG